MPRHVTLPFAASLHPDREWRRHEFWSTRFENDRARLFLSPLWQIAPLEVEFREYAWDHERFVAWEIRHTKEGEIIALFWSPERGRLFDRSQKTLVMGEDNRPLVRFERTEHQVCLTADRAWALGSWLAGPKTLRTSFSILVHALEDTNPKGDDKCDFYDTLRPAEPTMSDEDAAALEGYQG